MAQPPPAVGEAARPVGMRSRGRLCHAEHSRSRPRSSRLKSCKIEYGVPELPELRGRLPWPGRVGRMGRMGPMGRLAGGAAPLLPPPSGLKTGAAPAAPGGSRRRLSSSATFGAAVRPGQPGSPCRAPASRLPEAGVMLIPQWFEPHVRLLAAGGRWLLRGAPAARSHHPPTPSAERCTGHRAAARHSVRNGRPSSPSLSAGFPAPSPSRHRPPRAA